MKIRSDIKTEEVSILTTNYYYNSNSYSSSKKSINLAQIQSGFIP